MFIVKRPAGLKSERNTERVKDQQLLAAVAPDANQGLKKGEAAGETGRGKGCAYPP
jgi:hypothetical protein